MNKFSSYLRKKKPLLKELVDALSLKYEFVSILGTDVTGKSYFINKFLVHVTPTRISEAGFVIRVLKDNTYIEYSFNELEKNLINKIIEEVDKLSEVKISTNKTQLHKLQEENLKKDFVRKQKGKVYSDEEIIEKLQAIVKKGIDESPEIINVSLNYEQKEYSKIYISKNKELTQYYTWINSMCSINSKREDKIKNAYEGYGSNNSEDCFNWLEQAVVKTAKLAVELLDATLPTPGVYDIITGPSITGLIAHEAFGHGLEMDMFVKDRAKSVAYLGKEVASSLVSMHDGADAILSSASYFFDDEGALAKDTLIIDKGILKGGICDSISASILDYHPTGNGRRESYKRKAYTRMTNTFFEKGKDKLADMIKSIKYGYYIDVTNNGMEDPKNWGIQCTALYGREIVDGKFSGKMISPVVMSGYVIDLLKSISMISKDNFNVIGSGSCGKGYKEWVRVSDGGASIKAKVKIG